MPIAQIQTNINAQGSSTSENITYIHNDHLFTPRVMTDTNQTIVWRWDSDAFGEGNVDNDPDGDNNKVYMPLRFPGQMVEEPSGLYYNYFRDYDPKLGRYIQSDPIGLDGGINTFGYVEGNPLISSDPLGLCGTSQSLSWSRHGGFSCKPRPPSGCPNGAANCAAGLPPEPTKKEQNCIDDCEIQWVEVCLAAPGSRAKLITPAGAIPAGVCYLVAKLHCVSKKCDDCEE